MRDRGALISAARKDCWPFKCESLSYVALIRPRHSARGLSPADPDEMAATAPSPSSKRTIGAPWFARRPLLLAINRAMRIGHMYSAAPVLLLMLFFAVTGIYLNHPGLNEGAVSTQQRMLDLPPWAAGGWDDAGPPPALVPELLQWLDREHGIAGIDFEVEYDAADAVLVIDLAGPDGTTLVEVFFEDQAVAVDRRELSLLATLNNLHRVKHVAGFWRLLSDFGAVCMVVFSISGCWLMFMNRLHRRQTSLVLFAGCGVFVFAAFLLH